MEEAKTATEADGAGARNVSSVHGVVAKTVNEYALHLVTEALKFCGCRRTFHEGFRTSCRANAEEGNADNHSA